MMTPTVTAVLGAVLTFGACTTAQCDERLARPLPTGAARTGDGSPGAAASDPPSARPRAFGERVAEREALARTVEQGGIRDPKVLMAIRTVPRHEFVLSVFRVMAYEDRAMPIVGGQTISQPTVVARMTEAAKPTPASKCLEIGTGSGYQAAVLAEICKKTFSIEYLPEVARFGEEHLRAMGYGPDRVSLRVGDGYAGWPEAAPFDAILVTAAPEKVPEPLLTQLALGGRLVIPVGEKNGVQQLELWTRIAEGSGEKAFARDVLESVRFVPFMH
jgi:protein-L-isoaspartate(D-aspartate) O-methyltransferase